MLCCEDWRGLPIPFGSLIVVGFARLQMLVIAEITGTWVLLAVTICTGSPLLMSVIKVLGALYLLTAFLLLWSYRTSEFGRKWVPLMLEQWTDAPIAKSLRATGPPIDSAVARGGTVFLAVHTPLLIVYSIIPRALTMPSAREKNCS